MNFQKCKYIIKVETFSLAHAQLFVSHYNKGGVLKSGSFQAWGNPTPYCVFLPLCTHAQFANSFK